MKEEIESKDKQLARAKLNLEEREKLNEQHNSLYGNSCKYKSTVMHNFTITGVSAEVKVSGHCPPQSE